MKTQIFIGLGISLGFTLLLCYMFRVRARNRLAALAAAQASLLAFREQGGTVEAYERCKSIFEADEKYTLFGPDLCGRRHFHREAVWSLEQAIQSCRGNPKRVAELKEKLELLQKLVYEEDEDGDITYEASSYDKSRYCNSYPEGRRKPF